MKRHAAGMSPEELAMLNALYEGQRAGSLGLAAGLNPYNPGTPEHQEWERARSTVIAVRLMPRTA